jgi:hypothetical protein
VDEAQGGRAYLKEGGSRKQTTSSDAMIPQVHLVVDRYTSLEAYGGRGGDDSH